MLNKYFSHWLLIGGLGLATIGCEKAETNITEKDPIAEKSDDHNHDHETSGHGRLVVLNAGGTEALVYDLEDGAILDSFALTTPPSAVYGSASYRYAVMPNRNGDTVQFLDGGLWQEDHVEHLHDYEEAPVLLTYALSGSRPTHVVNHDSQLAVFYDGNSETDTPASITVITDADITRENPAPASIAYEINMHGAAEPRGDHVFASWRRDDADSTSGNPILPDQIAVYHLHDDGYEQEGILDVACPDLHGAAQNESFIAFGCSDGVLLVHEHDEVFEAEKLLNSEDVADGLRIGTLYGHEESGHFIGIASAHGGATSQFFSIDPEEGEMELIDWEPVADASIVARGFAFAAEQFLILDSQGYLTALEPHEHDGHVHWEYEGARIDISNDDIADMPENMNFSLAISQSGHIAYVADPIAQHILIIDLDLMQVIGDIELDYSPSSVTWLGIAEGHEHED